MVYYEYVDYVPSTHEISIIIAIALLATTVFVLAVKILKI